MAWTQLWIWWWGERFRCVVQVWEVGLARSHTLPSAIVCAMARRVVDGGPIRFRGNEDEWTLQVDAVQWGRAKVRVVVNEGPQCVGVECAAVHREEGHVGLGWWVDGWAGGGVAADEGSGVVAIVGPGFGKRGVGYKW